MDMHRTVRKPIHSNLNSIATQNLTDPLDIRSQIGSIGATLVSEPPSSDLTALLQRTLDAKSITEPHCSSLSPGAPVSTILPHVEDPPRLVALSNFTRIPCSVVLVQFETVQDSFDPRVTHTLRTSGVCMGADSSAVHPLLTNYVHGRIPLTLSDDAQPVHREFVRRVNDQALLGYDTVQMPPGSTLIFDNHRFAHKLEGPSEITIELRCFVTANPPEVDAVLAAAFDHPLYEGLVDASSKLDFSAWPITLKSDVQERLDTVFKKRYFRGGLHHLYWGWSSLTSTTSRNRKVRAPSSWADEHDMKVSEFVKNNLPVAIIPTMPADHKDVMRQRSVFRDLHVDAGLISEDMSVINTLPAGHGIRAMEVQTTLWSDLGVTNMPIGTLESFAQLAGIIQLYGVSTIVGATTHLLGLVLYCKRNNVDLTTLNSFVYGGEMMHEITHRSLETAFSNERRCKVTAIYGSSEIGLFAVRAPGAAGYSSRRDCMRLEIVDEEGKDLPEGVPGRLVVTNLYRKNEPSVRFDQGDRAYFIDKEQQVFMPTGRKRESIYRDFSKGSVRVYFTDIDDKVGEYLHRAFEGFMLYQVWISKMDNGMEEVTIAVFVAETKTQVLEPIEKKVVDILGEVVDGQACGVGRMSVKWLDDVQDIVYDFFKMELFVEK